MNKKNLEIKKNLFLAFENHKKENFVTAKKIYKKILKSDPNYFDAIFLLGTLLIQMKNFDEAISLLKKAILIQPSYGGAHYNLGLAFVEIKEFNLAIPHTQKAIQLEPNNVEAYNNLGNIFKELRDFKKSKACYEKAIQIKPNFVKAKNNLGNILKEQGKLTEAMNCYKEVIKIEPKQANAHYNLAVLFKVLGDFENTIKSFQEVIKYEPKNLIAIYELSNFQKKILDNDLKDKIKSILTDGGRNYENYAYGNFLLSKYELENKNYKKEFNYLLKGHENFFKSELKKFNKGIKYWLDELPKNKELINYNKENKEIKKIEHEIKPIFIIGFPRCGSTLVEKIIASSNQYIPIGEETNILTSFVGKKLNKNKSLNSDIENDRSILFEEYKNKKLIEKKSNYIFTDKSLDNFFYIGIIKKIFPNAKVINCKRNPTSSIMSLLKTILRDVTWAHNIVHIFKFFDIYYKMTENFKKTFPNYIYELEYEKFVENPESEAKKLISFCNLKWNKKCLEFYKRKDLISKTASNVQIRNAVYTDSINKYLPYREFLKKYGKKYSWFN
ncbi:MAG TPA: sulfotransferase family protein [Candidatus Pelagibacter sp.]|jgi:tetratricopeptide (TPR) repeat protein|nr:sulfotransferase family protein [Candidatus Pelagibacter sp.]